MKQVIAVLAVASLPMSAMAGGLGGDPAAIAEARAMVESIGGATIWGRLRSLHLVHEWYPYFRQDTCVENETLDLTGPRSLAERNSEISHTADDFYEVRFGAGDVPEFRRLEFRGPDGQPGG